MCARRLLFVLAAGCGRLHFDAMSDAMSDAQWATGPFGPAMPLVGLNSSLAEDDPTLSPNLLTIMFDSERDNPIGDLYVARRASLTASWSLPMLETMLSSAGDEDGPMLWRGDLTVTFSSDRSGTIGGNDLFIATRASATAPWSAPTIITELATARDEERFSVSSSGLHGLLFSNRVGGSGINDLWTTTRATVTSPWSTPVNAAELNTAADDADPCLDPTGLVAVFSSTRSGDYDLYIATRATPTAPFDPPVPIAELNTSNDETDPWISADGATIVFARGAVDGRELYIATR